MIATTLRMTRADSSALGPEEDKLQCKEGHDNKHEIPEEYARNKKKTCSKVNLLCLASSGSERK